MSLKTFECLSKILSSVNHKSLPILNLFFNDFVSKIQLTYFVEINLSKIFKLLIRTRNPIKLL